VGPGADEVGQKCLNLPLLWYHAQKPKTNTFEKFIKTTRLFGSLERLNSSLTAGELQVNMWLARSGLKRVRAHVICKCLVWIRNYVVWSLTDVFLIAAWTATYLTLGALSCVIDGTVSVNHGADNRAIGLPAIFKKCLVVRCNNKLQSICSPPQK